MELKEFLNKVVIGAKSKRRYVLYRITSPEIMIKTEQPDENGRYMFYTYSTINGDPISNGTLRFEDPSLTEPFKAAYDAYCRTQDARMEEYGYWMRKD